MNAINELKAQLKALKINESELNKRLQGEYNKIFDDSGLIKSALNELENSNEYYCDDFQGWIGQWSRVDLSAFNECISELNNYLMENHYCHYDSKNDALMGSTSPELVIDDDGNVYDQDSQKIIIQADEYSQCGDENTLENLVEYWMNKKGYYPNLFRVNRDGHPTFISTLKAGGTK